MIFCHGLHLKMKKKKSFCLVSYSGIEKKIAIQTPKENKPL